MLNLSRNLIIPVSLAVTILAGTFGFGRQSARSEQVETALMAHLKASKEAEERHATVHAELERNQAAMKESLGTRVTALEVTISNMNQALGRIEGKLDRNTGGGNGGRR